MEQLNTNSVVFAESISDLFIQAKHPNTHFHKTLFIIKNKRMLPSALIKSDIYSYVIAKNFNAAILQLKKLSGDQLPEAIIACYGQYLTKDIHHFSRFLLWDNELASIPFILINDAELTEDIRAAKAVPGVDDLVRSDITAEEIHNKIRLIKKIKVLNSVKDKETIPSAAPNRLFNKNKAGRRFKRAIDIILSLSILCCAAPFMLVIALVIKLESKGPVFYTSYRSGSNYQIFKFIKFRSMVADADRALSTLSSHNQYGNSERKEGVFFKISNDPRTTRFGKFLRNSSLDELPQLINVLKGDMSIVGNRPLPLYEAKTLTTDRYAERFDAPAGITGLWQVKKRGQKEMSSEERISLDIDYARNHSFLYDLRIILDTPKALAQKDNV